MTKTFTTTLGAALVALSTLAAPAAAAQESLTTRAVNALGLAIAAQGDAALVQIRAEITSQLIDRVKPYLPERREGSADAKPADQAATKR